VETKIQNIKINKLSKAKKKILTLKQEKYCQEYIKTGNKSQAYRNAYNSERMKSETINNKAYQLMLRDDIRTRVEELGKEVAERNKITVDECVSLLAQMARFDIADLYDENDALKPLSQIPKGARLVIEGLDSDEIKHDKIVIGHSKKVKLSSRRANIIELMKHLGGYEKDNRQKQSVNKDYSKLSDEEIISLSILEKKASS